MDSLHVYIIDFYATLEVAICKYFDDSWIHSCDTDYEMGSFSEHDNVSSGWYSRGPQYTRSWSHLVLQQCCRGRGTCRKKKRNKCHRKTLYTNLCLNVPLSNLNNFLVHMYRYLHSTRGGICFKFHICLYQLGNWQFKEVIYVNQIYFLTILQPDGKKRKLENDNHNHVSGL